VIFQEEKFDKKMTNSCCIEVNVVKYIDLRKKIEIEKMKNLMRNEIIYLL
jgi:hypothetical protein